MLPYILVSITAFLSFYLILLTYHKKTLIRLVVKMLASTGFIALAISCYHNGAQLYFSLILIALFTSSLGDLFLGLRHIKNKSIYFVLGFAFFSLAHVFYILLFTNIFPLVALDVIIPLLFLCFIIFYIFPSNRYNFANKKVYVLIYTFIIVLMLCKSMQLFFYQPSVSHILIATGGLLFFFSDSILMHVYYYHKQFFYAKALYIIFYYAAQILFALSILYL